ncbi:MAG: sulfotransferase family 2 domain-containing protein [Phycisphaerales bacterium]|nr:sulfotransferase family 2 domain-containing protein [Phycisphaerales bacterium]
MAFLLDNEAELGVIAIPKCGSSSIKYWWARVAKGILEPFQNHRQIHVVVRSDIVDKDRFAKQAHRLFVVAVVRDPLSRLASAFRSKFIGLGVLSRTCWPMVERVQLGLSSGEALPPKDGRRTLAGEGSVATFARVNYDLGISFRQFVHAVCEAPDEGLNPHWRPQSWFVGGVEVRMLGRLDHLQRTLDRVATHFGRTPVPLPDRPTRQPPSRHPRLGDAKGYPDVEAGRFRWNGVTPSDDDLFDESLRALVRSRYSADVELFERASREAAEWDGPRGGILRS